MTASTSAPCQPKEVRDQCKDCARRTESPLQLAESRPRIVVIDATVLKWPGGLCPMRA